MSKKVSLFYRSPKADIEPMFSKVNFAASILIIMAFVAMADNQSRSSGFARFKREMMPKVDKKVTVVGRLTAAKLGWLIAFKKWGVYIYTVNNSDDHKMRDLSRYEGYRVEVTGTLRYRQGSDSEGTDVAAVPEHFFFDIAEAKVKKSSRARRSNLR